MNKALLSFFMIFTVLLSSISYADSIFGDADDVSIDRVRVNGKAIAEGNTNFLEDEDEIDLQVALTATENVNNIHVEAVLTDASTGNTISDSSGTFSLKAGQSTLVALNLRLIDDLRRERDFRLEVRVVDVDDDEESKSYGIRFTGGKSASGVLDISIDRVRVNSKIVAESRTNFIDESNDFDVLVDITALEDLDDARIEAVLRDRNTGFSVSDSTANFDLGDDSSASKLLSLELLDNLKQSTSFELAIKVIDTEGDFEEKVYGLTMEDGHAKNSGNFRLLDISIDSVEIEGDSLAENENNFVIIDKGEKKLNLRVRLTSLENIEDAHIDAVLAFENGDVVADATTTFDIGDGENLVKDLSLPLIGRFEQNSFRLKVKVTDAEGDSEEKLYGLKLSQNKFPFVVSSILLPETNIEAGKSMVARINFRNSGVVPLEGISASASIPELGISSTKFVGNAKNSKAEIREEFILRIPENVPTGIYTLRSEIGSQFGGDKEIKELPVLIIGKDEQSRQVVNDKLVVNIPIASQNIYNDGSEAIYPIILTNEGPGANTYSLSLDGANWAKLRLSEPNVFVIEPGESKTINVIASSNGNAIGEQMFLAAIKSDGKVLKQIVLKGNVIAAKGLLAAKLKSILEIMLIGLVVLLIAIGLFFGIKKYIIGNSGNNAEEIPNQEQGEAYY